MREWIYGIVVVMLFGTVILQVTPEGSYQKYVRLFLGTLLMLTVTKPLYSWLGMWEETRLNFEQGSLASWMGAVSFEDDQSLGEWQETDRWEESMKEQIHQKQEDWVQQVLMSSVREYGFWYQDHEVQWNPQGNWPETLTLWVSRQEKEKQNTRESRGEDPTNTTIGIEGVSSVEPVRSVTREDTDTQKDGKKENYYEPSELLPLHQALQRVWQLEAGQIVIYFQR